MRDAAAVAIPHFVIKHFIKTLLYYLLYLLDPTKNTPGNSQIVFQFLFRQNRFSSVSGGQQGNYYSCHFASRMRVRFGIEPICCNIRVKKSDNNVTLLDFRSAQPICMKLKRRPSR